MRGLLGIVISLGIMASAGCGKDDKAGTSGGSGAQADKAGKSGGGGSYADKSKAVEAREFVKKIYRGARAYYMDPGVGAASIGAAAAEPQFPGPSVGPTPPLGACCKAGGKCAPDMALWSEPPWIALMFSVDDPHYYSYAYKVEGKKYTASAYGDLDCDGVYSTFEMVGEVTEASPDGPAASAELSVDKEFE